MSKQYVQHISGQGEKWEVLMANIAVWQAMSTLTGATFTLPKSEYRLCPAPEVWVDVTKECSMMDENLIHQLTGCHKTVTSIVPKDRYRFIKMQVYLMEPDRKPGVTIERSAFIVEKKVQS